MIDPSTYNADLAATIAEDYLRESVLLDGKYKATQAFLERFRVFTNKLEADLSQYDSFPLPPSDA